MSDFDNLFAKIKENRRKLTACTRHRIDPATYKFGKKMTCLNCGGEIDGPELLSYVRGYEAAGGDGEDIWPGINKSKRGDAS